jgi:preprotein translocase subunit SecA
VTGVQTCALPIFIAEAGRVGAITVTAKMAGRGVDIRLGGADSSGREEVVAAGGLAVIAVQRFDSRRADRQLRGRAGRQGDPGETLTYSSCEDHLVSVFAGTKLAAVLPTTKEFNNPEDLRVPGVAAMIDRAQRQLEQMNADIRRAQLSNDSLRSSQTEQFYRWRQQLLVDRELHAAIQHLFTVTLPSTSFRLRRTLRDRRALTALWPHDRPLPGGISTENAVEVLSDGLYADLRDRLDAAGIDHPQPQDAIAAAEDALVSALLEIADGLWADHLSTLNSLESTSEVGGSDARVVQAAELAFEEFNRSLSEQLAKVIWGALFSIRSNRG